MHAWFQFYACLFVPLHITGLTIPASSDLDNTLSLYLAAELVKNVEDICVTFSLYFAF